MSALWCLHLVSLTQWFSAGAHTQVQGVSKLHAGYIHILWFYLSPGVLKNKHSRVRGKYSVSLCLVFLQTFSQLLLPRLSVWNKKYVGSGILDMKTTSPTRETEGRTSSFKIPRVSDQEPASPYFQIPAHVACIGRKHRTSVFCSLCPAPPPHPLHVVLLSKINVRKKRGTRRHSITDC